MLFPVVVHFTVHGYSWFEGQGSKYDDDDDCSVTRGHDAFSFQTFSCLDLVLKIWPNQRTNISQSLVIWKRKEKGREKNHVVVCHMLFEEELRNKVLKNPPLSLQRKRNVCMVDDDT